MKSNIALIGFMGTGKTTVGRALAIRMGLKFIEMDTLIAEKASKSIPEIFRDGGEAAFRRLETEAVETTAQEESAVISCGGGIVLDRINIELLRRKSLIVLLTASPATIVNRVSGDGAERPLLQKKDSAAAVQELLKSREALYRQAADFSIDTSQLAVGEVVEQIITRMNKQREG